MDNRSTVVNPHVLFMENGKLIIPIILYILYVFNKSVYKFKSYGTCDSIINVMYEFVNRFIEHLQNVITHSCDSLTELRALKITVTAAYIRSPQSSLTIAW
jgi:hypothetical protein